MLTASASDPIADTEALWRDLSRQPTYSVLGVIVGTPHFRMARAAIK